MSLLKTVNLTKTYQVGNSSINALDNVSLEIQKGEFLAILGKSGSGKSTLMHILGLLDSPTSGSVYLNDNDVSKLDEVEMARIRNKEIGFVFQSFNLLPRTTSLENVMLPLQYGDVPRRQWEQKAKEMLQLVELGDRIKNKSNELSGGQKQRVAIARALVTEPSIIFADEPTGNLDSKTSVEIEKLFTKLHEQGRTIVFVTHDDDLAAIAKRKIVLADGRVVSE